MAHRRTHLFVMFRPGCATSFLYVFFQYFMWLMFLCLGLCGGGGLGTWSRHCAGAHTLGEFGADSVLARGGGLLSPQTRAQSACPRQNLSSGILWIDFRNEYFGFPCFFLRNIFNSDYISLYISKQRLHHFFDFL